MPNTWFTKPNDEDICLVKDTLTKSTTIAYLTSLRLISIKYLTLSLQYNSRLLPLQKKKSDLPDYHKISHISHHHNNIITE